MTITREELMKRFPKASEAFLRQNADQHVSHSAIGGTGALDQLVNRIESIEHVESTPVRQIRTVKEEKPKGATTVPEKVDLRSGGLQTIELILPYPPSANNYWRSIIAKGRVMVLVSSEAKHYKRAIAIIAKAKVKTPLAGPLVLILRLYRPQKSGDLSNRIKVLEDALQGVCYEDDNQITAIHAYRFDDKDNPRVELSIASAPGVDSQPLLALEP